MSTEESDKKQLSLQETVRFASDINDWSRLPGPHAHGYENKQTIWIPQLNLKGQVVTRITEKWSYKPESYRLSITIRDSDGSFLQDFQHEEEATGILEHRDPLQWVYRHITERAFSDSTANRDDPVLIDYLRRQLK